MSLLVEKDGYFISTNKNHLNIETVHYFLSKESYWAQGISKETVEKSIENSALCFGVYKGDPVNKDLVGFAKIISDLVTIAYLADVFILKDHRGKGLSKWLIETVTTHPKIYDVRKLLLATADAHTLYRKYGFEPLYRPEWMMEKTKKNTYKQQG